MAGLLRALRGRSRASGTGYLAGALARVEARYTWTRYAERLMTLARVYGFWRHVTNLERAETQRYLQMFYGLQFRPLANRLLD